MKTRFIEKARHLTQGAAQSVTLCVTLCAALLAGLAGCGTTGAATASGPSAADKAAQARAAQNAAQGASAALDARLGNAPAAVGQPAAQAPAAAAPAAAVQSTAASSGPLVSSGGKPAWVDEPYRVYYERDYLAAVGSAKTREDAEANALAELVAIFGQNIKSEIQSLSGYTSAVKDGAVSYREHSSMQQEIERSASMGGLVGAEIREVWTDTRAKNIYAIAVLERTRTNALYGDMIRDNLQFIETLTMLPASEKNTIEGYARVMLAATLADANQVFVNVLNVIGNTSGISAASLKKGNDYRLAARDISKNIPIGVVVRGIDEASGSRLASAFSKVITDAGFRTGNARSRYVLRVNAAISNLDLPNAQGFVYARIELSASLVDTMDDVALLPYSINRREGHTSISEARKRTISTAEEYIAGTVKDSKVKPEEKFNIVLQNYLSSMLPQH
ncbi:MAG: LPP20 family lipoprotein [Treponema sp.]|jgi:hypothetical protein|nr:LPP20 family lipoprotein [Treponema sp.]